MQRACEEVLDQVFERALDVEDADGNIIQGITDHWAGAIVNASRSILFAYASPQHADLPQERWAEADAANSMRLLPHDLGGLTKARLVSSGSNRS